MSPERSTSFVIAILLALACALSADGQSNNRRSAPTGKPGQASSQPKPTTPQPSDNFWSAQRSIEAAVQQLEAYLRESPDGERAATARRQVEALKAMSVSATRPEWVRMGQPYLRHIPVWRVTSADPQADKVSLTVEISCERDDGGDCFFTPFDRSPLVLVDNAGRYYPMLEAGGLPPDVRLDRDGTATVSGGRIISIMVNFAPLSTGTVAGQVYYRDRNAAQPARFSLTQGK